MGVGDSGNNALNRLMNEYASIDDGIEYWSVNSDASSLRQSQDYGGNIALLGPSTLGGKGTKGKTYKGMIAASESLEDITAMVGDSEVHVTDVMSQDSVEADVIVSAADIPVKEDKSGIAKVYRVGRPVG